MLSFATGTSVGGWGESDSREQSIHPSTWPAHPSWVLLQVLCPRPHLPSSAGLQLDSTDGDLFWIRKLLVLGLKMNYICSYSNTVFQSHTRILYSNCISAFDTSQQQPYCGHCASKVGAYIHVLRGQPCLPWAGTVPVWVRPDRSTVHLQTGKFPMWARKGVKERPSSQYLFL